ncbi:MAG TPA: glycoside hydrolase family 3 N-terminal domain-containing protein, partial [Aggregatilineaceae bacterium]|nr:glycoside hydrolase family 3 N-terminal domain-containing protein [Aggregatilineaceae bacterium]
CNPAAAVPRLKIPAYNYWSEALHGIARNGRATVFPQAIGMAATWDPDLIEKIASAIGDEGRAKYHAALRREGETDIYQGLTFWSPNVNIFRDPRWGRGQETWGEDPYLAGEMGAAFVHGLQGDHPTYLKAAACAKHFAVHSGPEKARHSFDARVSERDLRTTYLPAFKKLVTEAKVEAVMGAYNRTNGEPCCGSPTLLTDILRDEWKFEGHVVSDCGALDDFHLHHKVTADGAESAALALKSGCDLNCGTTYKKYLGEALERGLISEADIDQALMRTLGTRFKLGMFDPQENVPFAATPVSVIGCAEHRQLAYEAAVKSIVLLKNNNHILPIRKDIRRMLVIGPTATSMDVLLGNYFGLSDSLTTLVEGIVGRVPEGMGVEYRAGCHLTQPSSDIGVDWTMFMAAEADLTIACMGLSPILEGEEGDVVLSKEEGDRGGIGLPASQVQYLRKLAAAGAKIVLVLTGGSPITLGEIEDLVEAVVYVWYPGQEGGRAVANVLFGDESPSGKLPLTFPKSLDQLPPFVDYQMTGRTYRYGTFEPAYPFGFGLSYTSFAYSNLKLGQDVAAPGETVTAHFTLTNMGEVEAEEVAQFYLTDQEASVEVPFYSLIGFQRVRLKPGESTEIQFTVAPEAMRLIDDEGQARLEAGQFQLTVGGCSPMAAQADDSAFQRGVFTIREG